MRTAIQQLQGRATSVTAIPVELGEALARYPAARSLFEGLSAVDRRTYVEFIASAEDRDSRLQRAEQALTMLAERAAWAGGPGEPGA